MNERRLRLLAIAVGIVLFVIYSVIMIATEGTSPWAWLLLFAGIGLLFGSRRIGRPPPG